MANDIKVTQTLDDSQMLKELLKQQAELTRLRSKLKGVADGGREAGKQTGKGFDQATASLRNLAGAVAGIGSVAAGVQMVVRQVNSELQNIRSRQKDAATSQLSVAQAQRGAFGNFAADATVKSMEDLSKRISAIASKTGAQQVGLWGAASTALSSKGDLSNAQALEAVEAAAILDPGSSAAQETIARSILATQQRTGGTAKQVAGFQLAAKRLSPVSTNESFARNISPGIGDLMGFGDSPEQAVALLATMGQGMSDSEGATTRTASIGFAKQLAEQLPELGSTTERMRFLQSEEGASDRRKLLGVFDKEGKSANKAGLTGEAKAFTTMVGLLQGIETKQQRMLADFSKSVVPLKDSAAVLDKTVNKINAQPLQRAAGFDRYTKATAEELKIRDLFGGEISMNREGMQKVLKAAGAGSLQQNRAALNFETQVAQGIDPSVPFREEIEFQAKALEYQPRYKFLAPPTNVATKEDKETAAMLRNMLERLEGTQKVVVVGDNRPQPRRERPAKAVERKAN